MDNKKQILEIIAKYTNDIKFVNAIFYSEITEKKKKNASKTHGLDLYEEILFLIDHTLFGSATQSTIITEKRFSLVPDDSEPALQYDWVDLTKVDFVHGNYYFFDEDEKDEIEKFMVSHSLDSDDKFALPFAKMLTEISDLYPNPRKILFNEIEKASETENYEKIVELSDKYEDIYGDNFIVAYYKALALFHQEDLQNALSSINSSIKISDEIYETEEDKSGLTFILGLKSYILSSLNNHYEAIETLLVSHAYAKVNKEKFEIETRINEEYQFLKDNFSEIQDNRKKIISVSNEFSKVLPKTFTLLLATDLPAIAFPPGHPIEKNLYVAHPYLTNVYKPIENYETALFLHRYYEFRYFLQSLGATEIAIESLRGKSVENLSDKITKIGASVDYLIHSGEVKISNSTKSDSKVNNTEYFNSLQKFSPTREPQLPDNLVWFQHEDAWQELYKQRMMGNLLNYNEIISNKHSYSISKNEMLKISAEYEGVFGIKVNYSNSSSNFSQEEEIIEWKISVTFAPLNTLAKNEEKPQIENTLENNEIEYIDLLKVALEDDVITKDERRYLEKKQNDLKISSSRAIELENMIKSKSNLSGNELKYADEFKFIVQNNGKISNDERNILNKLKTKLNISEQRANEIENQISNLNKKKGFFSKLFGK